jgi:hypothetical protein
MTEYASRGDPGRTIAGGVAGLKWNPTGTIVIGGHLQNERTTVFCDYKLLDDCGPFFNPFGCGWWTSPAWATVASVLIV